MQQAHQPRFWEASENARLMRAGLKASVAYRWYSLPGAQRTAIVAAPLLVMLGLLITTLR